MSMHSRARTILRFAFLSLVSLALGACEPPGAGGAGGIAWAPRTDPVDLLFEEHIGEAIPERAGLIDYGRARLTPSGPALSAPRIERDPIDRGTKISVTDGVIIVDDRHGLRVVHEDHDVRMVLWLEPTDFETVVWTPAWATALPASLDPEPGEPRVGVRFAAGVMVDDLEEEDGYTLVDWRGPEIDVEAWLPSGHVRSYFRDVQDDFDPPYGDWGPVLEPGVEILDMPFGEPLATVAEQDTGFQPHAFASGGMAVTRVGEPLDGHQLVQRSAEDVFVRGWVSLDDLGPTPLGGYGSSGGYSTLCGGWHLHAPSSPTVPADVLLRASPEGEIVARTVDHLAVPPSRQDPETGAVAFQHRTPWGTATLWVDEVDVTDLALEYLEQL